MTQAAYGHILTLSDEVGILEHADHAVPRLGHGYCTDDVARLLVVLVREPEHGQALRDLARTSLRFLGQAQGVTGRTKNRRSVDWRWGGRWSGRYGVEDCWGRSVWAFGTAARRAPEEWMRLSARSSFEHGIQQRSPHRRAMAFAALGAAEVVAVEPGHHRANALLADAVTAIGPLSPDAEWPWPEQRLSYANAALPEVLIAAGDLLDRPEVVADGLTLLGWLLDRQTIGDHLSLTPVGGDGPGGVAPQFDQQPIEAAALADACVRAWQVTGDDAWWRGVDLAGRWFEGANDTGSVMWDPATGGAFDGLTPTGPNLNQGAESTLALISTMQLVAVRRGEARPGEAVTFSAMSAD